MAARRAAAVRKEADIWPDSPNIFFTAAKQMLPRNAVPIVKRYSGGTRIEAILLNLGGPRGGAVYAVRVEKRGYRSTVCLRMPNCSSGIDATLFHDAVAKEAVVLVCRGEVLKVTEDWSPSDFEWVTKEPSWVPRIRRAPLKVKRGPRLSTPKKRSA